MQECVCRTPAATGFDIELEWAKPLLRRTVDVGVIGISHLNAGLNKSLERLIVGFWVADHQWPLCAVMRPGPKGVPCPINN